MKIHIVRDLIDGGTYQTSTGLTIQVSKNVSADGVISMFFKIIKSTAILGERLPEKFQVLTPFTDLDAKMVLKLIK